MSKTDKNIEQINFHRSNAEDVTMYEKESTRKVTFIYIEDYMSYYQNESVDFTKEVIKNGETTISIEASRNQDESGITSMEVIELEDFFMESVSSDEENVNLQEEEHTNLPQTQVTKEKSETNAIENLVEVTKKQSTQVAKEKSIEIAEVDDLDSSKDVYIEVNVSDNEESSEVGSMHLSSDEDDNFGSSHDMPDMENFDVENNVSLSLLDDVEESTLVVVGESYIGAACSYFSSFF